MSGADDSSDVLLDADQLYAARAAMAQAQPGRRGLAVAELVRFLADPQRSLTAEDQRALFANPQLRSDFQRLKSRLRIGELPAQAAASSGEPDTRRFEGGTVRIHPSRVTGQVYVLLHFDWPAGSPSAILLEGAAGELAKRPLPQADGSGQVVLVLDVTRDTDQKFLQLLSDPLTTGAFLV